MSTKPILPIASAEAISLIGRTAGRFTPQYYDALRKAFGFLQTQIDQLDAILASITGLEEGQSDLSALLDEKADKTITITGGGSLSGGGDLSANRTLSLDNDNDAPGNRYYYGTNAAGAKGWYPFGSVAMGTATLVAGTATVSTAEITNTAKVFFANQSPGGVQGHISKGAVTAGTSFVINSTSNTDTSTIAWWIVEAA